MTIHCRIIAFLSADTSCDLVTLTFALLTLNSRHSWRVTWPTLPPSIKTLRLCVRQLRVITFPIGYHWKCVCDHFACAESRDPWVGGEKQLHFSNHGPRFVYSLFNFGGSTMNIINVICENNARPVLTRSSAIAEGPRDASCQLKSCQLRRSSAETTYTTSPDQIDGMKLEI